MNAILTFTRESLLGSKARKLRLAENLSQRDLAEIAGVTVEAVDLFEHNLPLPLDYKRRILRILWAKKAEDAAVSATHK